MTLPCRFREASPELCREWRELLEHAPPEKRLFAPEWYAVWADAAASRNGWTGRWGAVEVRSPDGALVGLLPLGEKRVGPLKVWAAAGEWQPWRTGVFHPDWESAAGSSLGRFVAAEFGHLVRLGPTPASQRWFTALLQRHGSLAGQHLERRVPLAVCRWDAGWDRYREEIIGSKGWRKIGYYERRLRRAAKVELKHFCNPDPDMVARVFDDLARIERHSWLATAPNGRMRFATSYGQRFWQRVARELLIPQGMFDSWILYADGDPASFCFTITCGDVRFVIANQYDEAFKAYRTGGLIYREMMRDGIERGVVTFDFGDGELHYKKHWGAAYVDVLESHVCVPTGSLGRLFDLVLGRILPQHVEQTPAASSVS